MRFAQARFFMMSSLGSATCSTIRSDPGGCSVTIRRTRPAMLAVMTEAAQTGQPAAWWRQGWPFRIWQLALLLFIVAAATGALLRSEEHTSELQSRGQLVCRLLLD